MTARKSRNVVCDNPGSAWLIVTINILVDNSIYLELSYLFLTKLQK